MRVSVHTGASLEVIPEVQSGPGRVGAKDVCCVANSVHLSQHRLETLFEQHSERQRDSISTARWLKNSGA